MNKKLIVAVGVALAAGVAISGAGCWRAMRFTESPCEGDGLSLTSAFLPAYDFAELRETQGEAAFRVVESAGKRCATAAAPEACESTVAAASAKGGWSNGSNGRMPGHRYIVATRGDQVVIVDGQLGAALAPIDSPLKAAAVASIDRNIGVACKKSVRKVEGGFEVHLVSSSCFGPADEVIGVAMNGATTVISAEHEPGTCVGFSPSPRERGGVRG